MPNFEFGVCLLLRAVGGNGTLENKFGIVGKNFGNVGKMFSLFKIEVIHTTVSIIFVVSTNTLWERGSYQIRLKLKVLGDWGNWGN